MQHFGAIAVAVVPSGAKWRGVKKHSQLLFS